MVVILACIATAWMAEAFLVYPVVRRWGKSTFKAVLYSILWPVAMPLYLFIKCIIAK